ncbi:hypothetical protein CJF32_00005466 [Rutstroemia sp. NJR-2017a WRK4]|nr:hypothetical protein CJF32_00005466 [Rutstroemia sp. NJR-2017a WRK4]
MSTTVTVPPMAPTNTINPLPNTPTTAANRPDTSATAYDLHAQTKTAAAQLKAAQKAEKAYNDKKKCMGARKDWYDAKEHFTSAAHGVKEGGKCLSRVIKAGPVLIMEQGMVVKDGLTKKRKENKKEKAAVENGEGEENEHAVATAAATAAAAAATQAPKEKKAKKQRTEEEKKAKKERKEKKKQAAEEREAGAATAVTGIEKKKQTLDQVRQRILCYTSRFKEEEDDEQLTAPIPRENQGAGSPSQSEEGGRRSEERRSGLIGGQGNSAPSANVGTTTSTIPTQVPETNPTSPSAGGSLGGSPSSSSPLSDANIPHAEGGASAADRGGRWSADGLKSRYSGMVGRLRGGDGESEAVVSGGSAVRESSPAASSVDVVETEKMATKNKKEKMTVAEKKKLLVQKIKLLLAELKSGKGEGENERDEFDSERGQSNFFSKLNSRRRYHVAQVRDLIDEILLRISTSFVEFSGKLAAARVRVGERSKKTRKVRFAKQKQKEEKDV